MTAGGFLSETKKLLISRISFRAGTGDIGVLTAGFQPVKIF
jgi:hypothetical protein